MGREEKRGTETVFNLDIAYYVRTVRKSIAVILMSACVIGIWSYLFLDYFVKDNYSVSVNLSVIARDNSVGRLNDYNMESAISRSINLLNSDTLKTQIKKTGKEGQAVGDITAIQMEKSNVITLTATGNSAETAYRTLKVTLDTYPDLSSYFESGYTLKTLGELSADDVVVMGNKSLLYALAAAFLVLAGCVGILVLRCMLTDVIHNSEQVLLMVDAEFLGSLRFLKKIQKAILISNEDTDFSYMEEVDKLVTRLEGQLSGQNSKVMMVTSIKENEGKSTVAANIALNLAKRGKEVLLIDADLRRPALAKIFDMTLTVEQEFSGYLEGKADLETYMKRNELHGFHYLFQTKPLANPDRLLEAERFKELLLEARETMDYVIMDTPPVDVVRDSEVLAGNCGAALLVMRQDRVGAAMVNDTIDILEDAGTTVVGCVLNAEKGIWESKEKKGHYSKYYAGYRKG